MRIMKGITFVPLVGAVLGGAPERRERTGAWNVRFTSTMYCSRVESGTISIMHVVRAG